MPYNKYESNLYSKYIMRLCEGFKKNSKVFDCGCGDGLHTSVIKKYSDNVIGGDFTNRTKKEYAINFRKIAVNKYGKESEFDAVTSFDVIEHVADDVGYLRELIKITKPGGVIIIGTPNRNRLSNKIISIMKEEIIYPRKLGFDWGSGGDIIHLREYTIEDLYLLAKKFKNIEEIEIKTCFLGLYTPYGEVGFKRFDMKFLGSHCQHLFLILKKCG